MAGVRCWLVPVALLLGRRIVGLVSGCGLNCSWGLILSAHVVAMLGLRVGVRIPVVRHVRLHLRLRRLVDGDHAAGHASTVICVVVKNGFKEVWYDDDTSADDRVFADKVLV